ncbi:MAG: hypothetical protein AB7G23_02940 [Vicinamibacterales bacterium]
MPARAGRPRRYHPRCAARIRQAHSRARRSAKPVEGDLTPDEIEAVFQAALARVRVVGVA